MRVCVSVSVSVSIGTCLPQRWVSQYVAFKDSEMGAHSSYYPMLLATEYPHQVLLLPPTHMHWPSFKAEVSVCPHFPRKQGGRCMHPHVLYLPACLSAAPPARPDCVLGGGRMVCSSVLLSIATGSCLLPPASLFLRLALPNPASRPPCFAPFPSPPPPLSGTEIHLACQLAFLQGQHRATHLGFERCAHTPADPTC